MRGSFASCVLSLAVLTGCSVSDPLAPCAGVRCTAGTCVARAHEAICVCGPEEVAAGLSCERIISEEDGAPDAGDGVLAPGIPQAGVLVNPAVRSFTFDAVPDDTAILTCTSDSADVPCGIILYSPAGRALAYGLADGNPSELRFQILEAGTYAAEVYVGSYAARMSFELSLSFIRDQIGDTARSAHELSNGGGFSGELPSAGETDVFFVRSPTRGSHRFKISAVGAEVRFYDASGLMVGAADVASDHRVMADQGEDRLAFIEATQPTAYSVVHTFDPDDHWDTEQKASPLLLGVPLDGEVSYPGDEDTFRVSADAGHVVRFDCSPECGWARTVNPAYVESGEVFATVTGREGPYRLNAIDTGPDDHADWKVNPPGSPEPLELGGLSELDSASGTFRIQYSGDFDAVTREHAASEAFWLELDPRCSLELAPPFGHLRRPLPFLDGPPGTHALRVSSSELVDCDLSLISLGPDDVPDSWPYPELPFPIDFSGVWETPYDEDIVRVNPSGVQELVLEGNGRVQLWQRSYGSGERFSVSSATDMVMVPLGDDPGQTYRLRSVE